MMPGHNLCKNIFYPAFGQCEVLCDTQSGFTRPPFQRFGLMPDGTPCSPDTQTFAERYNLPGTTGTSSHCVQGYCIVRSAF